MKVKMFCCLVNSSKQKYPFIIFITLLSNIVLQGIEANDYFSSITGLEQLLKTEQVLLDDLRLQLETTKYYANTLERELQTIEFEHALAAENTENYLTNPVNIYRLMKRLKIDWENLATLVRQMRDHIYFDKEMSVKQQHLSFPSKEDIEGSALALARLQSTYKLEVAQLAAGILNGIKYGTDMSWKDCFVLGQQLLELEDYNNTRVWLRESMNRLRQQQAIPEDVILNSMELVAKHFFELGDFETAYELSQRVLEYDPKRIRNWHLGDKAAQVEDSDIDIASRNVDSYSSTEEFEQYERLCREEITGTATHLRHLRCRYITNDKGFLLLAPIKMEEHNLDPFIVTFHDMMSSHNIDILKHIAVSANMQRSTVNPVSKGGKSKTSSFRVSKNAWLSYSEPFMKNMLRDLHDATDLDMTYCDSGACAKSAEPLQVANYGVGGHYEPHWDFFRDKNLYPAEEGNRIATAIFYLSDVEQGGATAFPFLNIAIRPHKGNVLFWYNLHRSLDMDYRTKHAGCPVLKGSKWIGNVWIHEMTQTFTRPCDLYRDNEVSLEYEIIK